MAARNLAWAVDLLWVVGCILKKLGRILWPTIFSICLACGTLGAKALSGNRQGWLIKIRLYAIYNPGNMMHNGPCR